MANISYVRTKEAPTLPPPPSQQGVLGWLWHNIFASMANFSTIGAAFRSIVMAILTLVIGYLLVMGIWGFLDFTIFSAVFENKLIVDAELYESYKTALAESHRIIDATASHEAELALKEMHSVLLESGSSSTNTVELVRGDICKLYNGACWPLIEEWFRGLMIGNKYPQEEAWRVYMVFALLAVGITWLIWEGAPFRSYVAVFMLIIFPIIAFVFLNGAPVLDNGKSTVTILSWAPVIGGLFIALWIFGSRGYLNDAGQVFGSIFGAAGLVIIALWLIPLIAYGMDVSLGFAVVPTQKWGGLMVTLVVALAGIIASLPIGVLLALGRQSDAPIIKYTCVIFIEIVRGVPLILVLFFAANMLPYFLDNDIDFNKLLRALVGVALFSSAYMAEVIRGGLQAIPKGQYEGGMSLGLSYWQQMRLIILPQALKIVIPGIVNTFIGLFKDTTLVVVISIFDLLGLAEKTMLKDVNWYSPTTPFTAYVFVGIVFWVFCFGMSRYSAYMERKLDRSHKS